MSHTPAAFSTKTAKNPDGLVENIKTIVYALLIALVLRSVLVQPFNIPSSSMRPNLIEGDYIFVAKWTYGYSKHSIQWSPPLFEGRIFAKEPSRGDIIVFKPPGAMDKDYIKRLIGLPGDRIQMRDGALYINDKAVERTAMADDMLTTPYGEVIKVKRWHETLPNGVSYVTYDAIENGEGDNTDVYTVPVGHYFMMGDNRDNSRDSRFNDIVGFVPYENLEGKAKWIMFSNDETLTWWNPISWVMSLRPDRFVKGLYE